MGKSEFENTEFKINLDHFVEETKKEQEQNEIHQKSRKKAISIIAIILSLIIVFITIGVVYLVGKENANEYIDYWNYGFDALSLDYDFTDVKVFDESSAISAAKDGAKILNLGNAADDLSLISNISLNNISYYRLQQNYEGIPVYGATFVIIADKNGDVMGMSCNGKNLTVDLSKIKTTKEKISENIIKKYNCKNADVERLDEKNLVIYPYEKVRLACYVEALVDDTEKISLLIDALNGDIICKNQTMDYALIDCTNKSQTLSFKGIKKSDNEYIMGNNQKQIYIYDGNNTDVFNYFNQSYNFKNTEIVKSKKPQFDDKYNIGINALNEVAEISSYYNSLGINDATVVLINDSSESVLGGRINTNELKGLTELGYKKEKIGIIVLGNEKELPATNTVAHEYTHTISRLYANWRTDIPLTKVNETSAINEAYSDLFGSIISCKLKSKEVDWVCTDRNAAKLVAVNNKNITFPEKVNSRKTFIADGSVGKATEECLFVEGTNSSYAHSYAPTIVHAAYLMNSAKTDALSIEEIERLWLTTLFTLNSDSSFSTLRTNMVMSAKNLGFSQEKISTVMSSFDSIGVEEKRLENCNTNFEVSVFDSQNQEYYNHKIKIEALQKLGFSNNSYFKEIDVKSKSDAKISLEKGIYKITVIDKENSQKIFTRNVILAPRYETKKLTFVTNFGNTANTNKFDFDEPVEMGFSSGAGAWCTELTLYNDGSFKGYYSASAAGDIGPDYPNGTCDECRFSGKFTNIVKVSDVQYVMDIGELETEGNEGEEKIVDGLRYVQSTPSGIEGGERFSLYLPEAPVYCLEEESISWWFDRQRDLSSLFCYALVNENTKETFFSSLSVETGTFSRYIKADGGLNLRKTASEKGKKILLMDDGAEVRVIEEKGEWSYVNYRGTVGWCASEFLVNQKEKIIITHEIAEKAIKDANKIIESYRGKKTRCGRSVIFENEIPNFYEKSAALSHWSVDLANILTYDAWYAENENYEFIETVGEDFEFPYYMFEPVDNWRFCTVEDVCDYYFAKCTDDIAVEALKDKLFYYNGELFAFAGSKGTVVEWENEFDVKKISDKKYRINIENYESWSEGTKKSEFKTELILEDSVWVFNDLSAPVNIGFATDPLLR